jgi:predicted alpha/beta-fold hydrolase
MAKHCAKQNWRAVGVNLRGCFDTPLKSPKMYGLVSSGDVKEAIDFIEVLMA